LSLAPKVEPQPAPKEDLHPLDTYNVQVLQSRLLKAEMELDNLKSEVREIVGRTWEAAVERNEDEMASEALGFETKHPDKETFIDGVLK
jgi:hypothetical protein